MISLPLLRHLLKKIKNNQQQLVQYAKNLEDSPAKNDWIARNGLDVWAILEQEDMPLIQRMQWACFFRLK